MDKKLLTKYIAFFVLGDGGLFYAGTKYPRIKISHVEEHKEYIEWKKSILETLTNCSLTLITQNVNDGHTRKKLWILNSKSHPVYKTVHDRLYLDGHRVIDPHYLKLLDWEALSILYQDDGSVGIDTRPNRAAVFYLHMSRYSYGDLLLVKKALKDTLNLEWNIQKNGHTGFRLQLRTKDNQHFLDNISQFIFPSFNYKIRTVNSSPSGDDETV